MLEVINVIVWAIFIYLLFIFVRGLNDTQVQKHKDKLDEAERRKENKQTEENKQND